MLHEVMGSAFLLAKGVIGAGLDGDHQHRCWGIRPEPIKRGAGETPACGCRTVTPPYLPYTILMSPWGCGGDRGFGAGAASGNTRGNHPPL